MKQIYLDSDDEITAIISKIKSLGKEKIAIIPPKRSAALQSVVNLKLLKKAASENDAELIIITRDPAILNIASQLKLLAAPNLETDPAVPEPAVSRQELPSPVIDGSQPTESDLKSADKAAADSSKKGKKGKDAKPSKKQKHKNVPDFNRFKKWILLGLLAILLLGFGVWAMFNLLPAADVAVEGRTREVNTEFTFQLDPTAEESDIENAVLAAESRQLSRTLSDTFEATGEKTVGEKATGTVTVINCEELGESIYIPAGTVFTAGNGSVFRNDNDVTVPGSSASPDFSCDEEGRENIAVTADEIGSDYNISPTSYSIDGFDPEKVYGEGTNMTGGSSEEVTVVSESDVDQARSDLLEAEEEGILQELRQQFEDNHYIVEASFAEDVNEIASEPEVGEEANEGRIILQMTYTVLAVEQEDMEELLGLQHREQSSEEAEGLAAIETGLEEAEISASDEDMTYTLAASGVLGPDLQIDSLKEELAGMAYTDAIERIESIPNVTRVRIDLSPFWASNVTSNPDKINIEFEITGQNQEEDEE